MSWLFLGSALVTTALGQVTYKLYFRERQRRVLAMAIAFFCCAPPSAYLALRSGMEVGFVYVSTAMTHVLVLALSWRLLGEQVKRDHVIAMTFIATGLVLYGFG